MSRQLITVTILTLACVLLTTDTSFTQTSQKSETGRDGSDRDQTNLITGGMSLHAAQQRMQALIHSTTRGDVRLVENVLYARAIGLANARICALWLTYPDSQLYLIEFDEHARDSLIIPFGRGTEATRQLSAFFDTLRIEAEFTKIVPGLWTPPELWVVTQRTGLEFLDPLELGPLVWRSVHQSTGEDYYLLYTGHVVKIEDARKAYFNARR